MEGRLHSEGNWEPQKVSEWEGVMTRMVLQADEDTGVQREDCRGRADGLVLEFSLQDSKPPDGTRLSLCSSAPQHPALGWPQSESSANRY